MSNSDTMTIKRLKHVITRYNEKLRLANKDTVHVLTDIVLDLNLLLMEEVEQS